MSTPESAGSVGRSSSTSDVEERRPSAPNVEERRTSASETPTNAGGVRARLAVHDPPNCPVADGLPSDAVATDVDRVRTGEHVVEQFRVSEPLPVETDADLVFAADEEYVYRRELDADECPCRLIESLGHPVTDVTVRTNPTRLVVTLSLPSVDPLGEIVEAIEAEGASVTLDRLTRSGSVDGSDPVVVDRARLTDRQHEVLRAARRLGYFEYPREASAAEVAEALGIARSTFAEHLAAAQKQVVGELTDP